LDLAEGKLYQNQRYVSDTAWENQKKVYEYRHAVRQLTQSTQLFLIGGRSGEPGATPLLFAVSSTVFLRARMCARNRDGKEDIR